MASFHGAREFRGNQCDEEEVDVISVEPIAMIVPPKLQDSPRTATLESSASSSTGGGSDDHWPSTSSDSPMEETPSEVEGVEEVGCSAPATSTEVEVVLFEGWESKVLSGRLDNLRKAPKTLPAGFKFRAALHHEVADGAATVKGYKKLEEWLGTPAKAVVFRSLFLCCLCLSTNGTRWYYILGREKMMIFTKIRNKVARWKRQFVFIRDTRTERISNELVARLSEWRTPNTYMNYPQLTVGDVNLKHRLLEYVKARGLVDLEALVTQEQIALLGFVDVANLHFEGNVNEHKARGTVELGPVPNARLALTSGHLRHLGTAHRIGVLAPRPRVEQRVEPTPLSSRRHAREDFDTEDDIPLIWRRMSTGNQPALAAVVRPANVPPAPAREVAKPTPASSSVAGPRIAYPDGLSYVRTNCQAVVLQGMQSFVPPANWQRAKGHVQQHGGHAALIKLMDAFSYTVALFECKQGTRSSEMANRATSAESRVDELARKVNELKEELKKAQAEKESGIQATKEEAGRAEDRAKKVESDREKTLHELSALRERVLQADQHIARAEASLERTKRLHQCDVCFARTQGAEWLGLPVWPPTIMEEGEDTEGLPSFDAWLADPQDMPVEPSNTPPSSLPQPAPTAAPALSPSDRSSPARSAAAHTDASIPVDLTND
ncbi:hypothetical protein SLEP1_g34475 [Rubroshorea leprosula]|uniref:Uncharacterized protein n=1 Tax=Rubroshorea leprosula TaxID=152421 RepID=A0AAV5KKC4_9ROSI|nr:hypothetical protein SLEP1_g34475 [Rubroshorea leprosula]